MDYGVIISRDVNSVPVVQDELTSKLYVLSYAERHKCGGEWSTSLPSHFTQGETVQGTYWVRRWVGSGDGLVTVVKRNISVSSRNKSLTFEHVSSYFPTVHSLGSFQNIVTMLSGRTEKCSREQLAVFSISLLFVSKDMHVGRLTKLCVAAEHKTLQTGKGRHPGADSSTSSAAEGSGFGRPQQV